jgi:hypothetical protein
VNVAAIADQRLRWPEGSRSVADHRVRHHIVSPGAAMNDAEDGPEPSAVEDLAGDRVDLGVAGDDRRDPSASRSGDGSPAGNAVASVRRPAA